MKSILMSFQPQWVEKIINGEKILEIRKFIPKCELPCKVYIYCSKTGRPLVLGQENACVDIHYTQTFGYNKKDEEKIWGILNGKVVAEFTLNTADEYEFELWDDNTYESIGKVYYDDETGEREIDIIETEREIADTKFMIDSKLTIEELRKYLGTGFHTCYALKIDDLVIYNKPKELDDFIKPCISPEMPYCPLCPVGTESISDENQEAYRAFG